VEAVKFNALEEKIKSIIDEYSVLKQRNQDLEMLLKGKEGELEDIKNKMKILHEERDTVRTKVDSLLDMLQNIPV